MKEQDLRVSWRGEFLAGRSTGTKILNQEYSHSQENNGARTEGVGEGRAADEIMGGLILAFTLREIGRR